MKFCILSAFLVSISFGYSANAGVEVGNGSDWLFARNIRCQNGGTKVEITAEANNQRALVSIYDENGWRNSFGTYQETLEMRDTCPPKHLDACGGERLLPTQVIKIQLEEGSLFQAEFDGVRNEGPGDLKSNGKNIPLSCEK